MSSPITAPTTGTAAFAVDNKGRRTVELEPAPRVRSASVIKPLLFWAAAALGPFADDRAVWEELAAPGITTSDNDATAALWSRVGEKPLLNWLNERAATSWCTAGAGEHPTLRVMVTGGELARAYAALGADDSAPAAQVRRWLRAVPPEQAFGLREVAAELRGVEAASVGIKCGWFGGERAHAVVLVEHELKTIGAVVTSSRPQDAIGHAAAQQASGDDGRLAALHDELFGRVIRSAARRALLVAAML